MRAPEPLFLFTGRYLVPDNQNFMVFSWWKSTSVEFAKPWTSNASEQSCRNLWQQECTRMRDHPRQLWTWCERRKDSCQLWSKEIFPKNNGAPSRNQHPPGELGSIFFLISWPRIQSLRRSFCSLTFAKVLLTTQQFQTTSLRISYSKPGLGICNDFVTSVTDVHSP